MLYKLLLFVLLCLLIQAPGAESAEIFPPTDHEVLAAVLSSALDHILESEAPPGKMKAAVSFPSSSLPSPLTRQSVEIVLTRRGYALVDDKNTADYTFVIHPTGVRVVIQEDKDTCFRTTTMAVHVKCLDTERVVVFASCRDEEQTDALRKNQLGDTDDSSLFLNENIRFILEEKRGKLRIVSFILIAGMLAYFSFRG